MNNKKWLTLCGMLLALFLFLGVSPPGRASASSYPDFGFVSSSKPSDLLSDGCISKIRDAHSSCLSSDPALRGYIVYNACGRYTKGYVWVTFLCEPDYEFNAGGTLGWAYLNHSKDCQQLFDTGMHGCRSYRIVDKGDNSTVTYVGGSVGDNWGLGSGTHVEHTSYEIPFSSSDIIACNFSFKDEDGKVFFVRTPLAANWLKIADQAIQEKLVEVQKNHPHLPELGQIQTGLIIVACCLVSLVLLTKLLRVWKSSLIR